MECKKIYKEAVDALNPSLELSNKVKSRRENKIMSKRKIAIIAVVACMMLGISAFAAGQIVEYRGWSDSNGSTLDYQETLLSAEGMDVSMVIPEKYSNGYEFSESNMKGTEGLDENGNVMAEGKGLVVTYSKSDCPDILLFVDPLFAAGDYSDAIECKEINGVNVYYTSDIYKFVPADYELTEEDRQSMDNGHYYISYGSDVVEVKNYEGIVFEEEGKIYNMFCWDGGMTSAEWFAMAEELLQ